MVKELLPGGLWPVMLTPFKEDGRPDTDGLERLTEVYIRTGADGLFANCLSSEMFELNDAERIEIVNTVIKTVNGRIPVVATGTFSKNETENANFIKRISDTGVKAVIINSSQFNSIEASEDDFKTKLESLVRKTGNTPLGIYECPVPYKRLLSSALMKWMAETGRFLYFKDTSCDLPSIENKLNVIKGSSLGLYNANMPTGIASMQMGARGLSPIGANLFPEVYSYLIHHYSDPSKSEQIKYLNSMLSVMDPLIHVCYPFTAKLVLQKRGLKIQTVTRTAMENISSQDYIKLNDLVFVFQQLMNELNIPGVI